MEKLKGIDIFLFKSYLEKPGFTDIGAGIWEILNFIFVNLPFMLLNVIVLVYSNLLKFMENFSIYHLYKTIIYDNSKTIWKYMIGDGSGVFSNTSILYVLLTISVVYLFIQWALSRGNFSRKVLHLLMVITLSFGYFGTINGTSGGIFLLDGIYKLSDEMIKTVNSVSIKIKDNETVDATVNFSDSYIEDTSYQTYLYVNTGRTDGKFFNNQTEKEEKFPTDKILGKVDDTGTFKPVLEKDRVDTINRLGRDSGDNKEKNRWLSAVPDFLFMKMFYVISSIFKAIVLPLPYLVIFILKMMAELLVLVLMLIFPIAVVLSFIPRFQDILFGFFKLILISVTVPSFGSIMLLVVSVVNLLISSFLANALSTDGQSTATNLLVTNFIFSFISAIIYIAFWKNKGFILTFLAGNIGSSVSDGVDEGVLFAGSGFYNLNDYVNYMKTRYQDTEITPYLEMQDYGVDDTPEMVEIEGEETDVKQSDIDDYEVSEEQENPFDKSDEETDAVSNPEGSGEEKGDLEVDPYNEFEAKDDQNDSSEELEVFPHQEKLGDEPTIMEIEDNDNMTDLDEELSGENQTEKEINDLPEESNQELELEDNQVEEAPIENVDRNVETLITEFRDEDDMKGDGGIEEVD
ncbi:hypothetical protein BBG03_03475 [Streptococcus dysgalactiae subsp. equisimilis]|uniref:hypothetical protein n=1 Tax=Streptococcus dysgalactiae TaxID=1334 RepID=UPI000806FDCB|nr:hypothetical protein [Streptococcus dysgalactiae]OBZ00656.1 hypothetical protein BBG03_03475 [Streptococcus dysgalactiae subsp. equisimilis]